MPTSFDKFADFEIVLDLSRLLSRITHSTPTGVDRCEMAYARGLLAIVPERLRFAAVHPFGAFGRLPTRSVLSFLDLTEQRWAEQGFHSRWDKAGSIFRSLVALYPRSLTEGDQLKRLYIQASPSNLTRPALVQKILARERAHYICLVHDLIPLEYPEYGRADGMRKHEARIATIANNADGIVTNSHSTLASLKPMIASSPRAPRVAVAHLGTHVPISAPQPSSSAPPYFVCIGTIEPRKNHLLLLHIWRRLSERLPAAAIPKLIIIGRRGWENEQVVDLLERCAALKDCVAEHNDMPDQQVTGLLRGARGLLLPSFAEGYGMPVAEALNLGVPVLCSDLAALREAGGDVPEFLDPLDGPAWARAILDYVDEGSVRRQQQIERMSSWKTPTWDNHLRIVLQLGQEIMS